MDFVKALDQAQQLPTAEDRPRSLYDGATAASSDPYVQVPPPRVPGQVPGMPVYHYAYHAKRYVFGKQLDGISPEGRKEFTDCNDEAAFVETMELILSGKALQTKRLETFLGDGTMVIWLEWATPKDKAPSGGRMTYEQLVDPRHPADIAAETAEKEEEAQREELERQKQQDAADAARLNRVFSVPEQSPNDEDAW